MLEQNVSRLIYFICAVAVLAIVIFVITQQWTSIQKLIDVYFAHKTIKM